MPIVAKQFKTELDQLIWVVSEIKNLVIGGVDPAEIAVIARKHAHLMSLVPIMTEFDVEIAYERGQNVFEKKEVGQIITILRFLDSLVDTENEPKYELLAEILCFEFLQIKPEEVFLLSNFAYKNKLNWLEAMQQIENTNLNIVSEFLICLGQKAKSASLDQVLDEIMGVAKTVKLPQNSEEEAELSLKQDIYNYNQTLGVINKIEAKIFENTDDMLTPYISGYKWYYFDKVKNNNQNPAYLSFLSALKVFIDAVRTYKSSRGLAQTLSVIDLLDFVDLMQSKKIPLIDKSPYNSSQKAVSLMTAHKSKGLEFEYVFVINCTQSGWVGKGMANKIGLPSNLSLLPQSENSDDSLRLFFVALTRAKRHLNLCTYKITDDGKELENLSFLSGIQDFELVEQGLLENNLDLKNHNSIQIDNESNSLETQKENQVSPLIVWFEANLKGDSRDFDLKSYLRPTLENYKLSVTHLNNFLDLVRGGPQRFLEQNLLRFPQAKSPTAAYGTAMHAAMNEFYKEFKKQGVKPNINFVLQKFNLSLLDQRLSKIDHQKFYEKGQSNLRLYFENQNHNFNILDRTEEDFIAQGVVLGKEKYQAKITGKIDKIIVTTEGLTQKQFVVSDFKTGKAHPKWNDSGVDTQVKLQNYRRQLVFYKLLVENSRDFSQYKVSQGQLEFLDLPSNQSKTVILETEITDLEAQELSKLIQVVYQKIVGLADGKLLPDVSQYSADMSGINAFIQDLINEYPEL
jgi:DNA helicase-2/ATP-dependent DNA helicase PcrA